MLKTKKVMFMKFKLMEEKSNKKLILVTICSKKKSLLIKSLMNLKILMLLESLKDMELLVLLKDLESKNFLEKLIEVLEKLVVLEHGIHPKLVGLLLELVIMVSIIELNKIKEFTESVKDLKKITLLLITT